MFCKTECSCPGPPGASPLPNSLGLLVLQASRGKSIPASSQHQAIHTSPSHQEAPTPSQWATSIAGDWWGWHRPGQTLRRGHILFVNDSRRGNDVPGAPNFIYTKARAPTQEDGPPAGPNPHPHPSLGVFGGRENKILWSNAALKVRGTKEADKIEIKMKMKSFHPGRAAPWIRVLFVCLLSFRAKGALTQTGRSRERYHQGKELHTSDGK